MASSGGLRTWSIDRQAELSNEPGIQWVANRDSTLAAVLDGKRCVGGAVLRHGARMMDSNGAVGPISSHWGPGILSHPAFSAGQTRYFQAFYRENPSTSCMTGQNTSNAISRVFQP